MLESVRRKGIATRRENRLSIESQPQPLRVRQFPRAGNVLPTKQVSKPSSTKIDYISAIEFILESDESIIRQEGKGRRCLERTRRQGSRDRRHWINEKGGEAVREREKGSVDRRREREREICDEYAHVYRWDRKKR